MPLLPVLVLAVLSMAAISAWLNWTKQLALLRERQNDVVRVLEEATFPLTQHVVRQMAQLSGQQFIVWSSSQGTVIASSVEGAPADLDRLMAMARSLDESGRTAETFDSNDDSYAVRVTQLKRQAGLKVIVLTSRRSLAKARWDALWPPLAIGGSALLVLILWLLALTRSWSRRIEDIQRSVAGIARGELTAIPPVMDRDDELSALMADIQRMAGRLQELQSELVQSERERLVAQLAAGFAHQFRNGVAGASLALQLHAGRCTTPTEKSLAVAQKQLRLLEIEIRGMLSLAKRVEAQRETVSVTELIDEVVELVGPAVEHHRIVLRCDVNGDNLSVDAYRDGLRAALLNLLLNAIDAAGPSGAISVDAEPSSGGLAISVRDNGPGPDPQVAERMEVAFMTTKPEGIGLGLAVVKAVADDHGGRLTWSRNADQTVFELWIPCQPQQVRVFDESSTSCR